MTSACETLTLEFDVGNKVVVCRDGVYAGLFSKVPQPHSIIITPCGHMVAIRTEVHGQHTLKVSI